MCHLVTFAQNFFHTQYWLHVQNIILPFFFHTLKLLFFLFSDVKSEKPKWQRAWFQRKVRQASYLLVNAWNWSYRTEIRHTNTGRPCEKFDTVSFFFLFMQGDWYKIAFFELAIVIKFCLLIRFFSPSTL